MVTAVFAFLPGAWLSRYVYVKCEGVKRAAARLKAAIDTEALAAQNAIIPPAMQEAKPKCSAECVNGEVLNCMERRMANYEAEGV